MNLISAPWISEDNKITVNLINKIKNVCNTKDINFYGYEISLSRIKDIVDQIDDEKDAQKCKLLSLELRKHIKNRFNTSISTAGFQTKTDDFFINEKGKRYYAENNIYYSYSKTKNKFAYNFKIRQLEGSKSVLDDSYIAFLYRENHYVQFGKPSKWWSPSPQQVLYYPIVLNHFLVLRLEVTGL